MRIAAWLSLSLSCAFFQTLSCGDDSGTGASNDGSSSSVTGSTGSSSTHAASTSNGSGTGGSGGATTSTSSSSGGGGAGGAPISGERVRVVAANLTSGDFQSYDPGQGERILTGIDGDVVLLQEFNIGTNSDDAITSMVEQVCGMDCSYVRGPTAQIPNGIISRFNVLESGSWTDALVDNRSFVWARLDVPGSADLWAVSVHLLTSNASDRADEASALLAHLTAQVPTGDFMVIGGDFNTTSRTEDALVTLGPKFTVEGPYPSDQSGDDSTNVTRSHPYDWVLPSDALAQRAIPVILGTSTTFAHGAVIDTRVYTPISDLTPAVAGDSGAPSMQHLAVVRDFALE